MPRGPGKKKNKTNKKGQTFVSTININNKKQSKQINQICSMRILIGNGLASTTSCG